MFGFCQEVRIFTEGNELSLIRKEGTEATLWTLPNYYVPGITQSVEADSLVRTEITIQSVGKATFRSISIDLLKDPLPSYSIEELTKIVYHKMESRNEPQS